MKNLIAFWACVFLCNPGYSQGTVKALNPRADTLCKAALSPENMSDLNWAFSALWLGHDLPEANHRLAIAYDQILDGSPEMTPEIADERAKWQMRTWVRIYYLFSDQSEWRPGRLEAGMQEKIEDLFWNYAVAKSTVARANLKYVWFIQGSENHDLMDLGNSFLALQALHEKEGYRSRPLPDGKLPTKHVEAWTTYFTEYANQRFKEGLSIEIASPIYGKYFIPELFNLFDFGEDPALKKAMRRYLDLLWADWAIEQLNGVRGGGKSRCYQGNYSRRAGSDSYRIMGNLLLEQGDWANPSTFAHPIHGFGFILATSKYTLPELVRDLALSPDDRGEYVYLSKRPGLMTGIEELPPLGGHPCWYHMNPKESRLLRYTWCTPDHVMGCFLDDPAVHHDFVVHSDWSEERARRYAAIHAQNRWQGIIFASDPDARIFPQCLGKPDKKKPNLSTTYLQQVAVQHENVLIVQMNRAVPANTAIRIFFSDGMKERLVEKEGWSFLEEGDSYVAVRVNSTSEGWLPGAATWDDNLFLRASEPYAPVLFITGRKARFPTREAFENWVVAQKGEITEGVLRFSFRDRGGDSKDLQMFLNESRLPEINGTPINLSPERTYDSPFFQTGPGNKEIFLHFQGKSLVFTQ